MKSVDQHRVEGLVTVAVWSLRLTLGFTLLSAVADRFGWWGPPGAAHATWGDWSHFVQYCAKVNSFLPLAWAEPLAWIATFLEITFGVGLIAGPFVRIAAYGSFALLILFALAMTASFGIKAPLDYSVFVGAAASLLLAAMLESRRHFPTSGSPQAQSRSSIESPIPLQPSN